MSRSNTANAANWFSRASASGLTAFPMSMSCWFYPFNLTSTSCLMAVSDAGATNYSAMMFDGANSYARGDNVLLLDHGFPGQEAITTAVASANTWNHACSVDASNTSHTAYLNGVAGTTQTGSMPPVSQNHIDVGALRSTTTTFSPLDGRIAEVAFWSAALTQDEVTMLSKGVSPLMVRPNNLNRYWPLIRGGANEIDRILREVLVQNGTMGQDEHVRQFYPTGPVLIGLGTAGGGTQNITAALVTDADTFFAATVSSTAGIAGALFTNANSFFASTVSATYAITGALYTDADTFYGATVAAGSVNISGALYSDADTFFGATVAAGAVNISGALFSDADTFFGATVSGTGSPQTITGALYSDTDTFFGATIAAGAVGITGSLYSDPDTFYAATVAQAADQAITGALYANDNTFYGATISGGLQSSIPNTGGSGNASHSGRGRNINDDPDAFSELLKEWRARKERPTQRSDASSQSLNIPVAISSIPKATETASDEVEADDLQEHLSRLEAAFDRSMVAYEAALAKMERARAAKAQKAAIAQEEQARQRAMQLAIEWELARLAYEDFLEEEDEIMLLTAA